jgi:hypothetical protein
MELNRKYTYTVPEGTISPTGIMLIQSLIGRQRVQSEEWQTLNPGRPEWALPHLPAMWEWVWLMRRGEYRGTLPKRVAQYYFKAHNLKGPDSFLQEVGNLGRRHSEDSSEYVFDVSRDFPLREGQFGDRHSCYYWECRRGVWRMLSDNSGMAIRFYHPGGAGYARAWLVEIEDGLHLIFNGHGFVSDATLIIARIFAGWRGASYKRISLDNNYTGQGVLWIDGDGGYIVGAPEQIAEMDDYDLEWPDIYTFYCACCGEGVLTDDYIVDEDIAYCSDSCQYDYEEDDYEEDEEEEEVDSDPRPKHRK